MTIELSSVCQDPNVSLSTTFIRFVPILLISCCCRCVRFESNVLYAYCTPFAEGKLVQLKINCQIYRLVMFLFSGIEWCILQEIKTIRAPLMIWAHSIPVGLLTASKVFFLHLRKWCIDFYAASVDCVLFTLFQNKVRKTSKSVLISVFQEISYPHYFEK
jgi:hypothetical protein